MHGQTTNQLQFTTTNELWREYDLMVDGQIVIVRFEDVTGIGIDTVTGEHYIYTADGVSHCVATATVPCFTVRCMPASEEDFEDESEQEACDCMGCRGLNDFADIEDLFEHLAQNESNFEAMRETEDEPELFALPEEIQNLFQRLGNFEPFSTEELESAAHYFRTLENQINRGNGA